MTIAVLGGETIFRTGVMAIISARMKHRCVEVSDPRNAIDMARQHRARLAIIGPLDGSFGEQSQVDVIERIVASIPLLPIIAVGNDVTARIMDPHAAGADVALAYNVSIEELVEVVGYLYKLDAPGVLSLRNGSVRQRLAESALIRDFSTPEIRDLAIRLGFGVFYKSYDARSLLTLELFKAAANLGRLEALIDLAESGRQGISVEKGNALELREPPIKVFAADDTDVARFGIQRMLKAVSDVEFVGSTNVAASVVADVHRLEPDVLVLDMMWGTEQEWGLNIVEQLTIELPRTKIVAMSAHPELLRRATMRGATAVIDKLFTVERLASTIRLAFAKQQSHGRA